MRPLGGAPLLEAILKYNNDLCLQMDRGRQLASAISTSAMSTSSISKRRLQRAEAIESFASFTEAGVLEAQALPRAAAFGGLPARMLLHRLSRYRPGPRRPGRRTRRELEELGVEYLELDVHSVCPDYGTTFRIHALAHLSRRPGPPILVQIDSDTLFLAEPDFSLQGVDVAARPVDVKGMCTTGEGDPFDPYWRNLCTLCEVDYALLPEVVTTVDRKTVRAHCNGGLVVAKRAAEYSSARRNFS